jgi:hypothetical protein
MKFLSLGSCATIHDDFRCDSEVFLLLKYGAPSLGDRCSIFRDRYSSRLWRPRRWDRHGACETTPSGTVPYPTRMKTSTAIDMLGLEYLCKSDTIDCTSARELEVVVSELFSGSERRFCVRPSSKLALSLKLPSLFLKQSHRISVGISAILYQIFRGYSESLCAYVELLPWNRQKHCL